MSGSKPDRGFRRDRITASIAVVVVAAFAIAPLAGASAYDVTILTHFLAYALLAMAISLMAGQGGLLTMAHAAYSGVAAYATGLVALHVTSDGIVQLLAAIGAGTAVAALTGWITARATKVYFLMLSLAIGELFYVLAVQWRAVTQGSDGLAAYTPLQFFGSAPLLLPGYVYWVALAVFVVLALAVVVVSRSPFGSALRGIRDNEARMASLGYPTVAYKYVAWVFSGAVAGGAGWLLVAQQPRLVSPDDLSFATAGLLLLAVVIGGAESLWGACLGAGVLVVMNDVVSQHLNGNGPLVLGVIFVVAVYVLPRGIAGIRLRRSVRPQPTIEVPAPAEEKAELSRTVSS